MKYSDVHSITYTFIQLQFEAVQNINVNNGVSDQSKRKQFVVMLPGGLLKVNK